MNKTNIAFSALVLALAFTSCVSSTKIEQTEKEEKKIEQTEIEQKAEVEEKSEAVEKKEEEEAEKVEERQEWSNGWWRVVGENGAERIENAEELLVDGKSGVRAKIEVQSENRLAIWFEGEKEKAVNTWSTSFSVSVQDSFGIEFVLSEAMRDGKLILNKDNSALVADLFASGGQLVFLLTNEEKSEEQYSFAVTNPEGTFSEALAELKNRYIGE